MNIAKKYFINYLWIVNFVIFIVLMFMLDYVDLDNEYIYSVDKYLFLMVLPIIDELNGGTFIIILLLYMTFSILYKINYKFLIINFEDFNLDMNIEHFKELILYLISNKEVIKLDSGYMLRENYDLAVNIIKDFIIKNGSISVSDARDLLNSNRKSTMELLEFLDKEKITLRKDNERILVK